MRLHLGVDCRIIVAAATLVVVVVVFYVDLIEALSALSWQPDVTIVTICQLCSVLHNPRVDGRESLQRFRKVQVNVMKRKVWTKHFLLPLRQVMRQNVIHDDNSDQRFRWYAHPTCAGRLATWQQLWRIPKVHDLPSRTICSNLRLYSRGISPLAALAFHSHLLSMTHMSCILVVIVDLTSHKYSDQDGWHQDVDRIWRSSAVCKQSTSCYHQLW